MNKYKLNNQSGAVVVLASAFILVLILIVTLAIETSYLQSGSTQVRQYVRAASLAAIREYYQAIETFEEDGGCLNRSGEQRNNLHRCAMEKARDRVIAVSSDNTLLANRSRLPKIMIAGDSPVAGEKAVLQAGWWITDQSICTDNNIGCEGQDRPTPYFWPFNGRISFEDLTLQPNGFRIFGVFYPEGMITQMGAYFTGRQNFTFNTESISSFVPRHIVFAVDLSQSIAYETHLRWTEFGPFDNEDPNNPPPNCCPRLEDGHGNNFAFELLKDNCNQAIRNINGIDTPIGDINNDPDLPVGRCYGEPNGPFTAYYPQMDSSYNELSWSNRTRWTYPHRTNGREVGTKNRPRFDMNTNVHHFASDYRRRMVVGGSGYYALSLTDDGLAQFHPQIDSFTDPGRSDLGFRPENMSKRLARVDYYRDSKYQGAQPYTLVIQSIREAICSFAEHRVPGDMIGLTFFDDGVDARGIVKLDPNNIEYLVGDCQDPLIDPIGLLDIEYFETEGESAKPNEDAIYQGGLGKGFDRMVRLGNIPRRLSYTDISSGLVASIFELLIAQTKTAIPANRRVILFTDGASNCPRINGVTNCRNFLADFKLASQQLLQFIDGSNAINNTNFPGVPIDVIPFGRHVGPHVRQVQNPNPNPDKVTPPGNGGSGRGGGGRKNDNPPSSCMTDDEFRKQWDGRLSSALFVQGNGSEANQVSAWVNMINGSYLNNATPFYSALEPMYRMAAVTGGLFGPLIDMSSEALSRCDQIIAAAESAGFQEEHFKEHQGRKYFNPETVEPLCNNTSFSSRPFIDGNRLLVDPYCRTPAAQVRDHLEKIMGGNPFTIVSVGGDAVEH